MVRSVMLGTGSYLPEKILTNDQLPANLETSHEWIVERTGIHQRHVAAEGEFTSDLATKAALRAIEASGIDLQSIDLIVLGTSTPDHTFPATATRVHANLGLTKGCAFDVAAVCSGFIFALATADSYIKAGMATTALVIGAETMTRILDWSDRRTAVLFGDGAGAIILQASHDDSATNGILGCHLRTNGGGYDKLYVSGGPSSTQTTGTILMEGSDVFRHAVEGLAESVEAILHKCNVSKDELDWLVPHQANARIIAATAKKLNLSQENVIYTGDKHANTSAASIPLALDIAVRDGRIKKGQLILCDAFGGGFSWGSALLRV